MSLLSIIVPVYGTEVYLKRCLDSILNQSYREFEVVIVNDCSQDGSKDIIDRYAKKDSRIRVIDHEKNEGLFKARVTGVKHANGEYIAFVDSDDYLSIDYYRTLMAIAKKEACDIIAGNTIRTHSGRFSQYTMHKICFGQEKLVGDDVREAFYGQEGSCYAWHTMWNKIYRKSLWDKCMPQFQQMEQHLIMTEDVAFSCVLFYHARSFMHVKNSSGYYYCFNEGASTNAEGITYKCFEKNMHDLIAAFGFVEKFLISVNADKNIHNHFRNFKKQYYMMWDRLRSDAFRYGENARKAEALIEEFGQNIEKKENYYFEFAESTWYEEIEDIRKRIAAEDIEVVSFDIFDTLLLRNVWNPSDVFELMQKRFEEVCPLYRNIGFKTIRQNAENIARGSIYRKKPGYEDVTLTEIYQELGEEFGLSEQCIEKLKTHEIEMEKLLLRERRTAKELFEFAKACNKRIVLISDMYLESATIREMLEQNGYKGFSKLFLSSEERMTKNSGKLFDKAISELEVPAQRIIHIGDNWQADICIAKKKGLQTAFLPKTKDRFCNTVASAPTNRLDSIGCLSGRQTTTWNKMHASMGYRSMKALVANELFDNPYASWNPMTDFDTNPYVMGYYAIGMHLMGVSKWLSEIIKKREIRHVSFLARDGYLPRLVFNELKSYWNIEQVSDNYVPCSRMCLLPWMIENEQGLYALPIEYRNHTPLSVMQLITCCYEPLGEEELSRRIEQAGFKANRVFDQQKEYFSFLKWFRESVFAFDRLEEAKAMTSAYYRKLIPENSLVFDLGYSGRILAALKKCLQYPVVFAYVHHDNAGFDTYRRRENLDVEVMYDFVPPFSDLIREYFLSEVGNSCIGLKKNGDSIVVQYKDMDVPFAERFVSERIKEGVMQFVRDYLQSFSCVKEQMYFNAVLASMPFEGLLQDSVYEDRRVLSLAYSDDTVYGRNERISMAQFWQEQAQCHISEAETDYYLDSFKGKLEGKSKLEKAIVYAICDRWLFKERLKVRFRNHPKAFKVAKSAYKTMKKVRSNLKGE